MGLLDDFKNKSIEFLEAQEQKAHALVIEKQKIEDELKAKGVKHYFHEFDDVILPGEKLENYFSFMSHAILFTENRLLIHAKKLGRTRRNITSMPYSKISRFSIETQGTFDLDSELRIWISSATEPTFKFELHKDDHVFSLFKLLSEKVR